MRLLAALALCISLIHGNIQAASIQSAILSNRVSGPESEAFKLLQRYYSGPASYSIASEISPIVEIAPPEPEYNNKKEEEVMNFMTHYWAGVLGRFREAQHDPSILGFRMLEEDNAPSESLSEKEPENIEPSSSIQEENLQSEPMEATENLPNSSIQELNEQSDEIQGTESLPEPEQKEDSSASVLCEGSECDVESSVPEFKNVMLSTHDNTLLSLFTALVKFIRESRATESISSAETSLTGTENNIQEQPELPEPTETKPEESVAEVKEEIKSEESKLEVPLEEPTVELREPVPDEPSVEESLPEEPRSEEVKEQPPEEIKREENSPQVPPEEPTAELSKPVPDEPSVEEVIEEIKSEEILPEATLEEPTVEVSEPVPDEPSVEESLPEESSIGDTPTEIKPEVVSAEAGEKPEVATLCEGSACAGSESIDHTPEEKPTIEETETKPVEIAPVIGEQIEMTPPCEEGDEQCKQQSADVEQSKPVESTDTTSEETMSPKLPKIENIGVTDIIRSFLKITSKIPLLQDGIIQTLEDPETRTKTLLAYKEFLKGYMCNIDEASLNAKYSWIEGLDNVASSIGSPLINLFNK